MKQFLFYWIMATIAIICGQLIQYYTKTKQYKTRAKIWEEEWAKTDLELLRYKAKYDIPIIKKKQ